MWGLNGGKVGCERLSRVCMDGRFKHCRTVHRVCYAVEVDDWLFDRERE